MTGVMTKKEERRPDIDQPEDTDDELDRELEDSFPASDPPSVTQPKPPRKADKEKSKP